MPLSISEMRTAASFLSIARTFVDNVRDYFLGHDVDCVARLSEISRRLDDEGDYVARLIAKASPNGSAKNG
jgi:hypothetical protein